MIGRKDILFVIGKKVKIIAEGEVRFGRILSNSEDSLILILETGNPVIINYDKITMIECMEGLK